MQLDLNNLPTDTALLHRLVRDIVGAIEHRETEIERLKSIIKQLQRMQFGRRSERLDPDQLALGLEDLDGDLAREEERLRGPRTNSGLPIAGRCRTICRARMCGSISMT